MKAKSLNLKPKNGRVARSGFGVSELPNPDGCLARNVGSLGGLAKREKQHNRSVYELRDAILAKLLDADESGSRQVDLLLEKCLERRPQDVMALIGRLLPKEEQQTGKGFTPIIVNAGEGAKVSIGQNGHEAGENAPRIDEVVDGRVNRPSTEKSPQNGREKVNGRALT